MENILFLKPFVHYFLHFGFPFFIAYGFYREDWRKAYYTLLATMLVDLDHIFTTPIFDPNRCSIGFHPLHSYYAIGIYALGCFFLKGKERVVAIGLMFHVFTDWQDCYFWK